MFWTLLETGTGIGQVQPGIEKTFRTIGKHNWADDTARLDRQREPYGFPTVCKPVCITGGNRVVCKSQFKDDLLRLVSQPPNSLVKVSVLNFANRQPSDRMRTLPHAHSERPPCQCQLSQMLEGTFPNHSAGFLQQREMGLRPRL